MASRNSIAIGEWYHCYNRGVDKRPIFGSEDDANRFLMHLYLCNGERAVALYNEAKPSVAQSFMENRGAPISAIGAFCLMPNHYHLLIKETDEGGITSFMRKLGTAYTMYFNAKYERVGHLFSGQFRSRHVVSDRYFQRVLEYIHLNPAELSESGWKSGKIRNMRQLEKKLLAYPYSSLSSYADRKRASPILSHEGFEIARYRPIARSLEEARLYYAETVRERFER